MFHYSALIALLAGCTGTAPGEFRGEDMLTYFPFAENTDCEWEFLSDDNALSYKLIARLVNEELVDDERRFTIGYEKDCVGEDPTCVEEDFVREMTWSVAGNQGVQLHRAETDAGEKVFDPPLRLVPRFMKRGDVHTWDGDGNTYTTTLEEFGDCPVRFEWTGCAKLVVTSSGGPDQVTGTYWVINDFNIVGMAWDDGGLPTWNLSNHFTLE